MVQEVLQRASRMPWRLIGWGGAAALLLLPLVAGAPWTLSDYLFMGLLFAICGLVIELTVRSSGSLAFRAGVAVAVAASFLLVWVNGAVGFLGNEDNPANLLFFGVIAVALLGSAVARFRPAGMATAMLAAAVAQVVIGVTGLAMGWASPGNDGIYEVAMGTSLFATLWLVSFGLLRKAAA